MESYVLSTQIQVPSHQPITACIGYFDGFHLGHQALFNRCLSLAKEHNHKSALISFEPDPWQILKPTENIHHLTSLDDRKQLAEAMGFDVWISIQFDEAMAHLDPQLFIDLLKRMNIRDLICGFDFRFGHLGHGSIEDLQNAETTTFHVTVLSAVEYDHHKISTTRIKEALLEGDMSCVEHCLGRSFSLKGTVVRGRQIGRKIGYPTANLQVSSEYIMPKVGVYSGFVKMEGLLYSAMIGLGYNPTVTEDNVISIEAHIFDFDRDIYDREVEFIFKRYVRGEIKFNTLDELMNKLKEDENECRRLNLIDLGKEM